MYDVLIIGTGVVGACVARELAKYDLKVIIVDKENDVSLGASKANSAIVHAGYDANHNSLKAKFNVLGSNMFEEFCRELDIPYKKIGSLVCAFNDDEEKKLIELKGNGELLDIKGLKILNGQEVMEMEANINPNIKSALYAPSAAITEPWEVAIACIENAMDNASLLKLNFEVKNIVKEDNYFLTSSADESIRSRYVVNAAGLYADDIYKLVNPNADFSIHPRRGEYFLLDKLVGDEVKHIVFPCPSELGKGVLVLPTVNGNILIGPDSENLDQTCKEAKETVRERLDYVKKSASKLIDNIAFDENITNFSGLRAQASTDDFIVGESDTVSGFFNLAGIKSPGLSCAPALGLHMANLIVEKKSAEIGEEISKRMDYIHKRKAIKSFNELSEAEKIIAIKENPLYGRIICRCEMISEAEIVESIHRKCGARSVNGVKRRVRPGAGRCQGGFCGPKVLEILSRELGIRAEDVRYETEKSYILTSRTKS